MTQSVHTIISRMTLEEKVAQLSGVDYTELFTNAPDGSSRFDASLLNATRPHGVGQLSKVWFLGYSIEELAASLREVQTAIQEQSRFGIGAIVHIEAVHGLILAGTPQFPTAWGQAATWDPDLTRRSAAISAQVMASTGMHVAFSPVLDVARDPRWGRVHETYGEDPELVSRFSVAFVQGMQAASSAGSPVLASGKHFLGYAASEGGINQAVTQLSRSDLIDVYSEPFRRAIAEADLRVVMSSYSEVDGIPASANRWLLTTLLRETLGFNGITVSDYDSVNMLRTIFHTAATPLETAVQAIDAGLDVELPGAINYPSLVEAVTDGKLDEAVVDLATERVLSIKDRLGLIGRGTSTSNATRPTPREDPTQLRSEIAARATVLLRNDGTLPLASGTKVLVVGPGADELRVHFGTYTSTASSEMAIGLRSLMQGAIPGVDPAAFNFTDIFRSRMPGTVPLFEAEARRIHPDAETVLGALRQHNVEVDYLAAGDFHDADIDAGEVSRAVALADVVVAVVGERTGWMGDNTAGEGRSSALPHLPGNQDDLISLLAQLGKPLVTVLVSGRPLLITEAAEASAAVLLAPLLGEEGGAAIAAALCGVVNPSGHLPMTFPRFAGQIPMYHGHHYASGYDHPTGPPAGYSDLSDQSPLYAFGHGLSYASFAITAEDEFARIVDGEIRAEITVKNESGLDGETVVQLYARDEVGSIVRPVRQLIDFARVAIPAGESRTLMLSAPLSRLAYTLPSGDRLLEAGDVTWMAGFASDDVRLTQTSSVPEIRVN